MPLMIASQIFIINIIEYESFAEVLSYFSMMGASTTPHKGHLHRCYQLGEIRERIFHLPPHTAHALSDERDDSQVAAPLGAYWHRLQAISKNFPAMPRYFIASSTLPRASKCYYNTVMISLCNIIKKDRVSRGGQYVY